MKMLQGSKDILNYFCKLLLDEYRTNYASYFNPITSIFLFFQTIRFCQTIFTVADLEHIPH